MRRTSWDFHDIFMAAKHAYVTTTNWVQILVNSNFGGKIIYIATNLHCKIINVNMILCD